MKRKSFFRGMSLLIVFVMLFSQLAYALPTEKNKGKRILRKDDAASTLVLMSPSDNSTVGTRPTFTWGPTGDNLKLRIAEDTGFSVGIREVSLATADVVVVSSGTYSYTIPNTAPALDSGKTYYWAMAAKDALGADVWSAYKTIKTEAAPALTAPTNFTATSRKDYVALNWDAVTGASKYEVLVDGASVEAATNTYTHSGLTVGVSHTYKVRAIGTGGPGTWSAEISAAAEAAPSAPSVTFSFSGTNPGQLMGATALMEYSLNGGSTYQTVTGNDMAIVAKNISYTNDIYIRIKAAGTKVAGEVQKIDILQGPAAPAVTGNDSTNTVTGMTTNMEFSTDGGNTWTAFNNNLPSLTGNLSLQVRIKGVNQTMPGTPVSISFTTYVPAAPNVTFSFSGNDALKLMGSTTAMEYSLDGGKYYMPIPSANYLLNIYNISPVNDIRIRVASAGTSAAGLVTYFDVIAGPTTEPAVTANDTANTVTGMTTNMEFSTNGVNWTAYLATNNLPNLTGTLLLMVRTKASNLTMAGVTKILTFTAPAGTVVAAGGAAAQTVTGAFPELPSIQGLAAVNATTSTKMSDAMEQMKTALLKTDGVTAEKSVENIGKTINSLKDLNTVLSKSTDKGITETLVNGVNSLLSTVNTAASRVNGDANVEKTLDNLDLAYSNTQAIFNTITDDAQKQRVADQMTQLVRTSNQMIANVKTADKAVKIATDLINGSASVLPQIKDAATANTMARELANIAGTALKKMSTQEITPSFENGIAKGSLSDAAQKDLLARVESIGGTKKALLDKIPGNTGNIDVQMKLNLTGAFAATSAQTELPCSILDAIKTKGLEKIEIGMGIATVNLSPTALSTVNLSKISLSVKKVDVTKDLTKEQKAAVGNNPVFDFSAAGITKDGKTKPISTFNSNIEVTIPYAFVNGQDMSKLTVFFVNNKGGLENKAAIYDPVTQTLSFRTNHFSKYFVKENKVTFTDLKGREADQPFIEAVAAKGLLLPANGTAFNPSGTFTKGELAKILISAATLSKMTDKTIDAKLKDVKKADPNYKYYYSALKQGILSSDKNGMFKANTKLTREEFAVIMGKWAKANKGWSVTSTEINGMSYGDKGTLKPESLESIALMTKYFVMIAKKGSDFKPADLVDRAEVARVLYRLLFTK